MDTVKMLKKRMSAFPPFLPDNIEGCHLLLQEIAQFRKELLIELKKLQAEVEDYKEEKLAFNKGWKAAQRGEPKGDRMDSEESGWMVFMFDDVTTALRDLYDWQNGPPLIKSQEQWQKAYDKAGDLLVRLRA